MDQQLRKCIMPPTLMLGDTQPPGTPGSGIQHLWPPWVSVSIKNNQNSRAVAAHALNPSTQR